MRDKTDPYTIQSMDKNALPSGTGLIRGGLVSLGHVQGVITRVSCFSAANAFLILDTNLCLSLADQRMATGRDFQVGGQLMRSAG